MKVLVIGAGNMGLTYAEGMSKSNLLKKKNIMVLDKSDEKLEELHKISHFDAFKELEDCVPKADIIFVAVKPHHAEDLFKKIQPLVTSDQILISIMAGVTLNAIQDFSGIMKVIRAMPNLPAKVGLGLTSYVASSEVSRIELLTVESLLNTTGKSIQVSDESLIDASTGISGSGPAYVFYFMKSMMEAALYMGFSKNESKVLVSQTFTGAIELFNQSNLSPNSWMEKVASKGGTTQAALDSMDDNNVNELIKDAAFAAFRRAVELGKETIMYKEIIVIKVGTNVMTNKDNRIVRPVLRRLVKQIAELYERGIITILVSSGSVIAGKEVLGNSSIKDKTQKRQVYSAIGQPRMMSLYYNIFQDYGMKCAQVLPTKRDFSPGIHRENMINCVQGLLSEGVIPVANEDDAVSLTMSMFSDNDELASLIAQLIDADRLIILTDIDGLYSGHPDEDSSNLIENVDPKEDLEKYIKDNGKLEGEGRGGMGSKLNYAQQTASYSIPTFIANGKKENTIIDIIEGKSVGTKVSL